MTRMLKKASALLTLLIAVPLLAAASPAGAETPPAAGTEVPIEEAFTVAEGATETGYGHPDISSDPITGRSLIVYNYALDEGLDGIDDEQVMARFVGNDGLIGAEFQVDTTLASAGFSGPEAPTATWNSTNTEWLVTWSDDVSVHGQRVDSDGTLIGTNFVIAANVAGIAADVDNSLSDIDEVRAEWSPTDGIYLVTFKAAGTDGGVAFTQTVVATVIDETGAWALDGSAVDVSEEEADNGVALSYSATSDAWIVGWERTATSALPGARVLSAEPSGDDFAIGFDTAVLAVSTTGTGGAGAPALAWDSERDRFVVIWRATQPGDPADQYYFNFVDADGTFIEGDEARMGDELTSVTRRASVAFSPEDDEFSVVAYAGDGGAPEESEILSWTIAGPDATVTATDVVEDVSTRQIEPVVAYGGGCFRYVWWDLGQLGDSANFAGEPDSVLASFDCAGCTVVEPGSGSFSDVSAGRFYDLPIGWLLDTGLTTGTTLTTYEPERGLTRGEFATFIWRYEGEPTAPAGSATFSDVVAGRFYDTAIGWFFQEGITTGTSPTTYDPDRSVTRGELAAFLYRQAGKPAAPLGSTTFSDVDPIRYYDAAVGWLFQEELTTGTTATTYEPERILYRGEMATFMYRLAGVVRCTPTE